MRRILGGARAFAAVMVIAAAGVGGAVAPAVAAPAASDAVGARPGVGALPVGVDDFSFDSFTGDYTLGRDADGRSTLTTVETLVAEFPESDQNHGIRRNLVDTYDGHPTDLTVLSVTDENGTPRAFEQDSDDGVLTLTIAAGDYVHGRQTYVISYTQRNVTRYFSDTDADEFYWDTNGTDWAQPFGSVTANVHLKDGLADALTGGVDAVWGYQGEQNPATITRIDDGYAFTAAGLGPNQNLSFAIGFAPGTFAARDDGFFAAPWPALSLLFLLVAVGALAWAVVIRVTRLKDAPGRGIIVPEYGPPSEGLLMAALVTGRTAKSVPAQILDLAVAGRVRVVEGERGFLGKQKYLLQFIGTEATGRQALRQPHPTRDELDMLHALFGDTLTPGEDRDLGSTDSRAVSRISKLQRRVQTDAVGYGYRRRRPNGLIAGAILTAVLGGAGALVFAFLALDAVVGGAWPVLFIVLGILLDVATFVTLGRTPLDEKGVALRDHVAGLDMYIRLAEADRIRYLQSPRGAERAPISTTDPRQMLELKERLLPWAVLLGYEKQWTAELGRAYEQLGEQPTWYYGSHPFNAALLTSAVSGIGSSVTSTYSSSSGGSGGGASSGGGGGGGGGGGV